MFVMVPRIVATVVTTAVASLFAMIVSITAIHASSLRWDGSFCTTKSCALATIAAKPNPATSATALR